MGGRILGAAALPPDPLTGHPRRPANAGVKGIDVLERFGALLIGRLPGCRGAWGPAARQ